MCIEQLAQEANEEAIIDVRHENIEATIQHMQRGQGEDKTNKNGEAVDVRRK